jgi:hypothetical protein
MSLTRTFKIIFDEHFKTATGDIHTTHSSYFEKLYESSAQWLYQDPFTDSPYTFQSFWADTPRSTDHVINTSKKRKFPANEAAMLSTPLRGSLNDMLHAHSPDALLTPLRGSLEDLPDAQPPTVLHEYYQNVPDALKGQIKDQIQQLSNHAVPTKSQKPYYKPISPSSACQTYLNKESIDGSLHILTASTTSVQSPTLSDDSPLQDVYNIFSACPDLRPEAPDDHLHAYPAVDSKTDTLTQSQMLSDPDKEHFLHSQGSEIAGLLKMNVFDVKHISQKPPKARLLSSIWSYKRKRSPIGHILKYKSRLCVDGSQQEFGRDYWETYAPVVSWSTIRLILLLSSILGLRTRQVDYTQAFPQAPLDDPVYMHMPQGWFIDDTGALRPHSDPKYNDKDHFIQLKKNLYGCKQAARNWFKYLTSGLLSQGFIQSKIDPCLYLRHDCLMVVYTDDCLIFAKNDAIIDDLIQALSTTYLLEDQGRVNDYLGIRITKDSHSKTISMTQPGLIEAILNDLHLSSSSKSKDSPALGILYPDLNGHPRQEKWNFRSVIGKLNFLAQNTRPDISFAVHQCARFSSKPTALHELAVKRLGRYLLATKDKGLILHPRHDYKLDMYVDADFAGMWHQEYSHLRDCALSRTGFVITYCGCPIHWASKLQSEIALSTTESEYIALSMATRELLPLRRLVMELHHNSLVSTPLHSEFSTTHTFHLEATTIYEDNASCIVLAYNDGTKV